VDNVYRGKVELNWAGIPDIWRSSGGKSHRNCQEIDRAVYNFPKVTFPETEHLNWCEKQSSFAKGLKWVTDNGLEVSRKWACNLVNEVLISLRES
jgi:hypothetical protein